MRSKSGGYNCSSHLNCCAEELAKRCSGYRSMRSTCVDQERATFCCVTWYGQSLGLCQSGSSAGNPFDIPGRIDMAMANPPDLCFLWSVPIYTYAALFPPLPEHLIGKLTRSRDALGNILVKRVHNRVCDGEGLILEGRVGRESRDKLAKRGEVPKKAPSCHIGHNKVGRSELEVLVGLRASERFHMP